MKIIILRSDPINPEVRLEKEAKSLAKSGHSVIVLGWDRSSNCRKVERRDGYDIYRFKLNAPYGTLTLIPHLILWNVYCLFFLLTRDFDAIHSCNFDTLLPSILAGKLKRKKIVYDIFDFYGPMIEVSIPNILRKFISLAERKLSQMSDVIILVDETRQEQLGPNNNREIVYIYNTPEAINFNTKNSTIKHNFIIFYAGVLLVTRGLQQMINITENLENTELIVAGYGKDEKILNDFFRKKNVRFLGRIPYDKVIENTLEADMIFALYDPSIPNNKFASPNKLFEAMMCGKPILVSEGTSMANIVRKYQCGVVVNFNNLEDIRNSIIQLKNNPELCKQLGENGRNAYEARYNWKKMEMKLMYIYNNMQ